MRQQIESDEGQGLVPANHGRLHCFVEGEESYIYIVDSARGLRHAYKQEHIASSCTLTFQSAPPSIYL